MSFPTNWDVNRYKAEYESDEHWELRKAFIEEHKDKFPESELVCLAQVFTNIEFLGCRYPGKTMERIALLSKDVAAKFRASRSGRLKRTFVGASDAASAKAKGRGSKAETTQSINQNTAKKMKFPSITSSFRKEKSISTIEESSSNTNDNKNNTNKHKSVVITNDDSDSDDGNMPRPSFTMNPQTNSIENTTQPKPLLKHTKRIPNTGFIIYETLTQTNGQPSINILQVSAAKQGATIKCDVEVGQSEPNTLACVVRINGNVYGRALITTGKKEAKLQAFDAALERAKKIHYTIKQKSMNTVSVDVEQNGGNGIGESGPSQNSTQLDEGNIGFKMMKMLGWSGGALGVSGNGIEQPISIEMKVDRCGLGLTDSTKLNHDFFVDYLTKYQTDASMTYDLAFSKEFTKDERKALHEIANRLGLKSRSHNTADGSRYIVIFKKLSLVDLANEILNNGLRSQCYELIAPTEPLPEKPKEIQNKPPPRYLQQQKTNKVAFNYTQQNRFNQQQRPNLKNKRTNFF